jgi:hypothetical protein
VRQIVADFSATFRPKDIVTSQVRQNVAASIDEDSRPRQHDGVFLTLRIYTGNPNIQRKPTCGDLGLRAAGAVPACGRSPRSSKVRPVRSRFCGLRRSWAVWNGWPRMRHIGAPPDTVFFDVVEIIVERAGTEAPERAAYKTAA